MNSCCFLSPIFLAGMPATIAKGSTSLVKIAPDATTAPRPIFTPGNIILREQIQAYSSISTGPPTV